MSVTDRVRRLLPPKYREFAKFLVVGGTSWTVDATIFTILTLTTLQENVITAKVISMLISTILSYILNREWSFNTRGGRNIPHEATLFFLFNGIGLLINLIPLVVTHHVMGINHDSGYSALTVKLVDWLMANIVGTFIAMFFRYWSYRTFVFPAELKPRSPRTTATSDRRPPR